MARKTHSQDSTRRDAALLKHFREACEPFENIKKTIAMASGRRKSEERSLLFMRAVEELERAERAVCNLFEEGATWQRKFDGLEEACGTDRRVDLETVAWL